MHELDELDQRSADFSRRGLRIIAVSVDNREQTETTQRRFPNLIVLGDPEHQMTDAIHAIHVGAGPGRSDVAAPTTLVLDANGTVRWFFRTDNVLKRLTPDELLTAIDAHAPKQGGPAS